MPRNKTLSDKLREFAISAELSKFADRKETREAIDLLHKCADYMEDQKSRIELIRNKSINLAHKAHEDFYI